jgi:crotonobetainyl-CoA:carnitine CoA-transferase CaiB-like acyl-CoA transferase
MCPCWCSPVLTSSRAQVSADGTLDGLTVLELSSFVAAALGGMTLAQPGAQAIRTDPVGGGPDLRRWPLAPSGTTLYWTGLNKGKRSVTLNFRALEGRRLLGDLLRAFGNGGGIMLTNVVGQGRLRYSALAQLCPGLIHLQIQGHRDGRAAVDYTVNATTGLPLITGPEGFADPVNRVLREMSQPGSGPSTRLLRPLVMDGVADPRPALELGADTESVLSGLLGLTAADVRALAERGIVDGVSLR